MWQLISPYIINFCINDKKGTFKYPTKQCFLACSWPTHAYKSKSKILDLELYIACYSSLRHVNVCASFYDLGAIVVDHSDLTRYVDYVEGVGEEMG